MENKRIWAMVGVVYMVIATMLMTYWIATTTLLTGITGIMLAPACAGLAVQCFNSRWKCLHQENAKGSPVVFLLLGIACAAAAVYTLCSGIPRLIQQLP